MKYTIHDLHEQLVNKEISAVELTKKIIAHRNSVEGDIHAYLSTSDDSALVQAAKVDAKIAAGEAISDLAGIPGAIKDNMCIKGETCTAASKMLEHWVSPYDATVIEKLKKEDFISLGKTNMDEFAMGSSTENSAFFKTLNPRNNLCVPGGSSGGSACAVAADLGFASVGTDTGGSVRQPASLCGVVGLKGTYGLVSRYGIVAFASSLDQAGPLTKTVKDSALMFNVLTGYDEKEETSVNRPKEDYMTSFTGSVKGVKIGVIKECFGEGLNEDVKKAILDAIEFYKSQGAEIVELSMPFINNALACYYILSSAEAASNLARFDGVKYGVSIDNPKNINDLYLQNRSKGFGKEVKRRIMLGNYVLSSGYYDAYYKKAKKVQRKIVQQFDQVFNSCDVILTPTSPTPAFKIGERVNDPLSMYLSDIYTVPVNIAELPAISIPCAYTDDGLPIGMQLIGKKYGEKTIFNVADVFETQKGAK